MIQSCILGHRILENLILEYSILEKLIWGLKHIEGKSTQENKNVARKPIWGTQR